MSEENVEVVRDAIEAVSAFIRGDMGNEAFQRFSIRRVSALGGRADVPDFPQHLDGTPEIVENLAQLRSAWVDWTWRA